MTDVAVVTLPVVTENVAELEPCGTVTETGTLAAAELELESDTTAPPGPADVERLTVPVLDCRLTTMLGLTETLLSVGATGLTVMPNVAMTLE